MANFTKGPWTIEMTQTEDGEPFGYVLADEGIVTMVTLRPEQVEANTNLIAAAPDLLYALKCIVDELPSKRDWLDPVTEAMAKQAIAKAEGK